MRAWIFLIMPHPSPQIKFILKKKMGLIYKEKTLSPTHQQILEMGKTLLKQEIPKLGRLPTFSTKLGRLKLSFSKRHLGMGK